MCNAERDGAKLVTGGHRLNTPGSFLAPTIFSDVTSDMEIAQTEVFGPVLAVLKTTSEADAIRIANGTDYGLVGGIFTADIDAAHKAARHIRAGQIFINEWFAGGVKPPLAAMANMAGKRDVRRCGITCRRKI